MILQVDELILTGQQAGPKPKSLRDAEALERYEAQQARKRRASHA
jgi:hypothetical protein